MGCRRSVAPAGGLPANAAPHQSVAPHSARVWQDRSVTARWRGRPLGHLRAVAASAWSCWLRAVGWRGARRRSAPDDGVGLQSNRGPRGPRGPRCRGCRGRRRGRGCCGLGTVGAMHPGAIALQGIEGTLVPLQRQLEAAVGAQRVGNDHGWREPCPEESGARLVVGKEGIRQQAARIGRRQPPPAAAQSPAGSATAWLGGQVVAEPGRRGVGLEGRVATGCGVAPLLTSK